jgi:protein gp37
MSDNSAIQWTDATWNPIRARNRVTGRTGWFCIHKSAGCLHCYAEDMNVWIGTGDPYAAPRLKDVALYLDEKILEAPLRWKRPRKIFVCSMTDLFGEWVPEQWIDRVVGVMGSCDRHVYQVLTKRPERLREYVNDWQRRVQKSWPKHIHLGVSVEHQAAADERIPLLRLTPAAVRFLSVEPLLGPVSLDPEWHVAIDWMIVGGESGPEARPCDLAWIRSIVAQCKAAGVPCFVKQAGSRPVVDGQPLTLHDRKGGDMWEWPEDLRVREMP